MLFKKNQKKKDMKYTLRLLGGSLAAPWRLLGGSLAAPNLQNQSHTRAEANPLKNRRVRLRSCMALAIIKLALSQASHKPEGK